MRYGLQMLAISGVNVLAGRITQILMGRILGLDALGLYSRASSLTDLLWSNIHGVMTQVIFVELSEQRRRGVTLRHSYLRTVQMVTALLWPAFAGLAILAGPLVNLLYGPVWIGAALPLSLLSLAAMILVSITMSWEVFVICEETARQAQFEFIRALASVVLFALASLISLTGVAAAKVLEAAFAVALYRHHLERMTHTHRRDYMPLYGQSLLLTGLAVLPVTLVMLEHGWATDTPMVPLIVATTAGMAAWAAGLLMLKHPLVDEASVLVGRGRRGSRSSTKRLVS